MISISHVHQSERISSEGGGSLEANRALWDVEVFFDGDCPLCRREIAMLQRFDRKRRIRFTDIAAKDFNPTDYGISRQQLMAEIHARLPDETWIMGVEVFRRLYGAIGLSWLIPFTRLPGISCGLELGYRLFAQNRLKWTGRCSQSNDSCDLTKATNPKAQVVDGE
jgi:predicted DCC family thiol-disulfide oxidoreductase YuxK